MSKNEVTNKVRKKNKVFWNQAEEKAFQDLALMKNMFGGDSDFSIESSPHSINPKKVLRASKNDLSSFESSNFVTTESNQDNNQQIEPQS